MKVPNMQAGHVTFCVVFLINVFASVSSNNSLAKGNNLKNGCSKSEFSVNFSGSVMQRLGKNFISNPLITCLNLQGNQIENVEKGAFDGLPALRYLNMAGNNIVDLTSFGGHENLEILILANQSYDSYNYASNVLEIAGIYPQLRYLDLSGNNIRQIEWIIEDKYGYRDLSQQLPKLTHLDLSNNIINRCFTHHLSSITLDLKHLYLSNNAMKFANLKYFRNIEILIADKNMFMNLNKNYCFDYSLCVTDMPKLKILSVSNSLLDRIDPDFFGHMTELTTLNLSSNSLNNNVDGLFDDCISLQNLNLDNNRLTNISVFKKQSNLYIFSAKKNNIEYINSEDFINMTNLRQLHLSNNNISNIDKNTFSSLKLLEELHLAYNFLTNLPAEWSNNLKSLRYLDVTGNKFKRLASLSLSKTLPLTELYLLDSKIISFSPMTLLALPENVTIYLAYGQKEINPETND